MASPLASTSSGQQGYTLTNAQRTWVFRYVAIARFQENLEDDKNFTAKTYALIDELLTPKLERIGLVKLPSHQCYRSIFLCHLKYGAVTSNSTAQKTGPKFRPRGLFQWDAPGRTAACPFKKAATQLAKEGECVSHEAVVARAMGLKLAEE